MPMDGYFANFPITHPQFDPNDGNACIPQAVGGTCPCGTQTVMAKSSSATNLIPTSKRPSKSASGSGLSTSRKATPAALASSKPLCRKTDFVDTVNKKSRVGFPTWLFSWFLFL
jgi:hypothetical protein